MNAFLANPNIVNNQLFAHSQSTKDRIQQALDAGYEITIHEAPITQDGWTGAGFSVIDPNTGAGGYLIEGGSNGAWLYLTATFVFALLSLTILAAFGPFAILGYGWMLIASFASAGAYLDAIGATINWSAVSNWVGLFLAVISFSMIIPALGILLLGGAIIFAGVIGLITAIYSVLS